MSYPEIPDISRLSVDTRGAEIVDDVTEVGYAGISRNGTKC